MGVYKELNSTIENYIGYNEKELPNGDIIFECADPDLLECIVNEIDRHFKGIVSIDDMSEVSKLCLVEWNDKMREFNLMNKVLRGGYDG